jgi:C-terminal processing protease CtpA/Prc
MRSPCAVTPAEITKVIQTLSTRLREDYVFPDVAEKICDDLKKYSEEDSFTGITEGESLATMLTELLREATNDNHLKVTYKKDLIPDHEGSLGENQEWLDEWHKKAQLDNYGLHKVERLPGNVGLLDIREFYPPDWGGDIASAAMNFINATNAFIIDLRKCRGGDPGMVCFLLTYLFDEERVHLNDFYWRRGNTTEQYWTLPDVPGKRFRDKPVFVLISGETFSGGEEFAYDLKALKRATLVGEKTGGGANIGAPYRLTSHFEAFIPVGRPVNPITGTNWEGCGVIPDVSVSAEQAFKVAYNYALKSILASMDEEPSESLQLLLDEAQTALKEMNFVE